MAVDGGCRGLRDNCSRFFFALDCPLSYLTAERVERALGQVIWVPVLGPLSEADGPASCADRVERARDTMRRAMSESRVLRMPLVRPERFPIDSRPAARAATFAADHGVGAGSRFSLALARLAFCGGFDISKESVIRQAGEVAGLDPDALVDAAHDPAFDVRLDQRSMALRSLGVDAPPAIAIGEHIFDGPDAILEAKAYRSSCSRAEVPVELADRL